MAHDPQLLTSDEPTSSLSASEAERLVLLIALSARGVAVLYTPHRTVRYRRIALARVEMRDGEISGVFARRGA